MKTWLGRLMWGCVAGLIAAPVHAQQNSPASQPASVQNRRLTDSINDDLPRWIRLSGEYRVRVEGVSGAGFRSNISDGYLLNRVRINAGFSPLRWLRVQLQAQDAQALWRGPKPDGPPHEDTFDLRQAFLEFGASETNRFSLRLGRQELAFGEQRLVGHLGWTNTARSFDGVRATYRRPNLRLDVFASSVVNPKDGEFNKRIDGNNFHGVYATLSGLVPRASVEPYVFWREAGSTPSEAGVPGKLDFATYGFRWAGKLPARFDYGVEIAGQTGSLGSDDVRAWAGHWLVGYSFDTTAAPRVIAEYNYASGDADPADGRRGAFDQLYPTGHDKYGLADQVGWRNIHAVRAGVELKPAEKLTVVGAYHSWWLADVHDGLYNAGSGLIARVADGSAGRHVGHEADIQAVYAVTGEIQLSGGYARIFPGAFLRNATPGETHQFSYVMINYLF